MRLHSTLRFIRDLWTCVLSASIGGILFGYDTGVISSALVLFQADLGHALDNSEKQLLTSLTGGGAFVGALLAALVTDAVCWPFIGVSLRPLGEIGYTTDSNNPMTGWPKVGDRNRLYLVHCWLGSCRTSIFGSSDGNCPVYHWSWDRL